jgi:hypothetical protein
MTKLDRLQRAMRRTEIAARAANMVLEALHDLENDDLFEVSEKRIRQHYRVMQYYGEVLRDLCQTQEPLLEPKLPKELTDLLGAAN